MDNMKRKRLLIFLAIVSFAYISSYCALRLSNLLVHQEIALIYRESPSSSNHTEGYQPSICYTIHHDIGRGSLTDDNNYNKINTPSKPVKIAKILYYPLIKMEIKYWNTTGPKAIYETICTQ